MPRCFSISIQSEVAWRALLRAFTVPAIWIAPPNSSSFSVRVVLPASGCEMMAKVRRLATSRTRSAGKVGASMFYVTVQLKMRSAKAAVQTIKKPPAIQLRAATSGAIIPTTSTADRTAGGVGLRLECRNLRDSRIVTTAATFQIDYLQFLDAQGKVVAPLPAFAKDAGKLAELYRAMVLMRTYDAKAIALQRTGQLGTYASLLGKEAVEAG